MFLCVYCMTWRVQVPRKIAAICRGVFYMFTITARYVSIYISLQLGPSLVRGHIATTTLILRPSLRCFPDSINSLFINVRVFHMAEPPVEFLHVHDNSLALSLRTVFPKKIKDLSRKKTKQKKNICVMPCTPLYVCSLATSQPSPVWTSTIRMPSEFSSRA